MCPLAFPRTYSRAHQADRRLFFQSSLTSAWPEPRRGGGPSAQQALTWRVKVSPTLKLQGLSWFHHEERDLAVVCLVHAYKRHPGKGVFQSRPVKERTFHKKEHSRSCEVFASYTCWRADGNHYHCLYSHARGVQLPGSQGSGSTGLGEQRNCFQRDGNAACLLGSTQEWYFW